MAPTLWSFVATFAVPAPLALLVLLNIPLPKPFRRGVLIFVSRVFDMPLIGVFKTLHVMLFVLATAFLSAVRQLQLIRESHTNPPPLSTPNYEIQYLSKRWRAERNMWLSAFAFTMWAVLAAFYRELGRRLQAEERLIEIEMSMDGGYTIDTTKEVSSRPRSDALSPRSVGGGRNSAAPSPVKPGRPPRAPTATPTGPATAVAGAPAGAANETAKGSSPPEVELTPGRFDKKDQ